jgi:hypothetical protein
LDHKNRKQLPMFGYLDNFKVSVSDVVEYCFKNNLLDPAKYNDIKVSSGSKMAPFVLANNFSKSSFFTEQDAAHLEGEAYKQLYLTDIKPDSTYSNIDSESKKSSQSPGQRQSRLNKTHPSYNYFADELNYGSRNSIAQGALGDILNLFSDQITRVRLAWLAPNFEIKPHIDYDPSYITRIHLPLLTNSSCLMHIFKSNVEHTFHFPADGRFYFLNAGHKHYASNSSTVGRVHLIIDMHGQRCLDQLISLDESAMIIG